MQIEKYAIKWKFHLRTKPKWVIPAFRYMFIFKSSLLFQPKFYNIAEQPLVGEDV